MNSDDPRLTAYALDELDPSERAEIEQLFREHPELGPEIQEVRAFGEKLRAQLGIEHAEALRPEQRAEVLAEAGQVGAGRPGVEAASSKRTPARVARGPRHALWISALAACAIVGLGLALLYPLLNQQLEELVPRSQATVRDHESVLVQPPVEQAADSLAVADPKVPALTIDSPAPLIAAAPPLTSPRAELADLASFGNGQAQLGLELAEQADAKAASTSWAKGGTASTEVFRRKEGEALSREPSRANTPAASAPAPSAGPAPSYANGRSRPAPAKKLRGAVPEPQESEAVSEQAVNLRTGGATKQADSQSLAWKSEAASAGVRRAEPLDTTTENLAAAELATPRSYEYKTPAGSEARRLLRENRASPRDSLEKAKVPMVEEKLAEIDPGTRLYFQPEVAEAGTESYEDPGENRFVPVTEQPLSTFSIDVDTASYANVRRFLNSNALPPKAAVRIEELINYFRYDYPAPAEGEPFSVNMEVATCGWQSEHRLLRVGLKGREMKRDQRPANNLVFLIDVSGSMRPENKLPLLKRSLNLLVDQLTERDQVAIVVYAGASGLVLEPTHSKARIRAAIDQLGAGGSTHGSAGIQLAYETAERAFLKGGSNRVILATDGDFNVGVTNRGELVQLIEKKAKGGVFLSVLGFGIGNLKDATLEQLANKGNGNYAYIDTLNEGRRVLVEQMDATLMTIAKDVKIQIEFNPVQVGAYRLVGYENRMLAKQDFDDDRKDAGEIGAGHTVTALYQLVPAGKDVPSAPPADELKYQRRVEPEAEERRQKSEVRSQTPEVSRELLTLKLRFKAPDADQSQLREFPLVDSRRSFEASSRDFRFVSSVASFGMLLRNSPHKGSSNWELVHELASEGKGDDRDGYRTEFIGLVEKAKALTR
ncbi:MAG: von Willebrand factor type A domain-containing protein [Verrucomicrobiota bacterium]|nr:von Willebrand factor type A domain-containing protein [Verrucomicrobiota bacterium]